MGGRHGTSVPARRPETLLRPVPEDWRAEGRNAACVHLQYRREPLGPTEKLAAVLRRRLSGTPETAISGARVRLGIRQADRFQGYRGFLGVRPRQAGSVSSAPG